MKNVILFSLLCIYISAYFGWPFLRMFSGYISGKFLYLPNCKSNTVLTVNSQKDLAPKPSSLIYSLVKLRFFVSLFSEYSRLWASLVTQMVKKSPAMRETWIGSLGREDPLEKGMTSHSTILVGRIPWSEEPGELKSMGSQKVRQDWATGKKKKIQTLAIKSFTRTWVGAFSS